MARKFKEARMALKLTQAEIAARLGVSVPALSAWEREIKYPSVENLLAMAELYGESTDYLLGRSEVRQGEPVELPISSTELRTMNGMPVWSARHGWLLVDVAAQKLIRSDGTTLPLNEAGKLFQRPPAYAQSPNMKRTPLRRKELRPDTAVWVEPISPDAELRGELRGWYRVFATHVENDAGHRFLLSSYAAKWLAFETE